ncbi:MAG: hypothetical protein JSV61_16750 [Anaerolineales bacterium]|nr:MAG: hypothetical protein JSV61_16750 [Anaerolineales bacterium]
MGFYVREFSQRLVRWPGRTWMGVGMFEWLGVRSLLQQDWTARQPAVLGASLLLVILLFIAGIHLEKLHAMVVLAFFGLPMAILLVSGE